MKTEKVTIANLKCGGCEQTIIKSLMGMEGVQSVVVDQELDSVMIESAENTKRSDIVQALHTLGYPEATEENGLLLQLKSYVSCAIGRLSKA